MMSTLCFGLYMSNLYIVYNVFLRLATSKVCTAHLSLPLLRVHLTTAHMQDYTVIRFSLSRFVLSSELSVCLPAFAARRSVSLCGARKTMHPERFLFILPQGLPTAILLPDCQFPHWFVFVSLLPFPVAVSLPWLSWPLLLSFLHLLHLMLLL